MNLNNAITHELILNTDNYANPKINPTININQQNLILEQFFIWYDDCITGSTDTVPTSGYTCDIKCEQN